MKAKDRPRERERERTAVNHFCFYDHNFLYVSGAGSGEADSSCISWSAQPDLCVYKLRFDPLLPFVVIQLELSSSPQQCSFLQSPLGDSVACCLSIFNFAAALAVGYYLLLFHYLARTACYYVHFAICQYL